MENLNSQFIRNTITLKTAFIGFFLLLTLNSAEASFKFQDGAFNKIDKLLEEADALKFENDSLGLLKVKEAEKLAIKLKNNQKLGEVYTLYGIIYYMQGSYDLSLKMYLKAIPIHEKYVNDKFLARSLNGVALIQSGYNQLEEAIATFKKSLVIDEKNKNYLGITRTLFNISLAEIALEQYDNATTTLHRALKTSKKINIEQSNLKIESKLADLMRDRNKPDSAFYYYNLVLKSVSPSPDNREKMYVYIGMAETYFKIKDYDKAEKYGLLSYQYVKEINTDADVARIAKVLSEIYEKKGNTSKALQFLKITNTSEAKIYNEKKLNEINYLQLKSKEIENLKLVAKNERTNQEAKRNRIIIYSFSALIVLLIVTIFLIRRNARLKDAFNRELQQKNQNIETQKNFIAKQNKDLMSLNESKNQIFSIISHDLRTPINSIVQVLEFQKENIFSPELQDEIFQKLHVQAQSTSKMLNNLLEWASTQMEGQVINFEPIDVKILIDSVVEFYALEINKKRINLINTLNDFVPLIKADVAQARIIIQNVLVNAVKFTSENESITIKISENKDFVNIHIINSGKKISVDKINQILNFNNRMTSELGTDLELGTGLGLLLVKQFLANNQGMLDLKSTEDFGTEFTISFLKN